ncbi:hypothetical protein JRG19_03380 [Pseudoclavibacter alba]|uniref:PH domain-containing protein n=1 Tax=Pseudoclavibacter albus TaxID=272241 RepID=A0ABT2HWA9_9MICO|nr:hypothetical protein [Pseudoclavibacter alba]MBN6777593.1 hypothetical protein [Pseudoclavibacter alba]MCT2042594.1 hypothetical protein [Pseudoclavibacter alba]
MVIATIGAVALCAGIGMPIGSGRLTPSWRINLFMLIFGSVTRLVGFVFFALAGWLVVGRRRLVIRDDGVGLLTGSTTAPNTQWWMSWSEVAVVGEAPIGNYQQPIMTLFRHGSERAAECPWPMRNAHVAIALARGLAQRGS